MPNPKSEKPVEKSKKVEESKKADETRRIDKGKKVEESKPVDEGKPAEGEVKPVEELKKKKKRVLKVPKGIAHIKATFNNTIITIADPEGNAIISASAGSVGFKGTKKSTPFAASRAADTAGKKVLALGMKEISVYIKGPGAGREAAIRSLESAGLSIVLIRDVTPIPHDGCRPPKRRRV